MYLKYCENWKKIIDKFDELCETKSEKKFQGKIIRLHPKIVEQYLKIKKYF